MSRVPSLSSPFLLGFDEIERALDRVAKASDGYPPYNIERVAREDGRPERLRITLAVAGFNRDELDITVEESQRIRSGAGVDAVLHRGASRRICALLQAAVGSAVFGLVSQTRHGLVSRSLISRTVRC